MTTTIKAAWVWSRGMFIAAFLLLTACATIEHVLEARDARLMTAHDTFFSVHGKRVRYRLMGQDHQGPTVVLMSGLWAALEQWDDVQQQLSESVPVLSYDRGGMGFSDPSDAHDALGEADELLELLKAPGVSRTVVLVGYSSSVFTARVFAARHPDLVAAMVLVAPSPRQRHKHSPPYSAVTYTRDLRRMLVVGELKSLFGVMRLKHQIETRHAPTTSLLDAKTWAILESSHHWFASLLESTALDLSSQEAEASGGYHDMPLGLLVTSSGPVDLAERPQQCEVLTRSTNTTFRIAEHVDHSTVIAAGHDAQVIHFILDMHAAATATMRHSNEEGLYSAR